MNSNANSASEVSNRRSLIGIRLQMLVDLFGKRVNEEGMGALRRVYGDALDRFTTGAISKAFTKAEQEMEKFPTPRALVQLCAEATPSQAWRYGYQDATDGNGVHCKIDPETSEKLYRPQDCPEGRAFLAKFAELAGRKK